MQKQPATNSKRDEPKQGSNSDKIVGALQTIAEQENATADHQEAESRFQHRIEIRAIKLERRKFCLDFAGVIGLWIAAAVGIAAILFASRDADTSNTTNREAFTAVQRAFIVVSGLKEEEIKDASGKITAIRFTPTIRNSGNTPARDIQWVALNPFNTGFDPNLRQLGSINSPPDPDTFIQVPSQFYAVGKGYLGPHDTLPLGPEFPINDRTFQRSLSGVGKFYFGSIRYVDVFSNKQRITKYCYSINNFTDSGGFEAKGPTVVAPSVRPFPNLCPHWNCADDQCDADQKRYAEEQAAIKVRAPSR